MGSGQNLSYKNWDTGNGIRSPKSGVIPRNHGVSGQRNGHWGPGWSMKLGSSWDQSQVKVDAKAHRAP